MLRVVQQNGSVFRGDPDDLLRRFTGAEDDLGKAFSQRAVGVHLREAEVGDRRGLKSPQQFVPADFAGPKFFQQLDGFRRSHRPRMPRVSSIDISNLSGRRGDDDGRDDGDWRTDTRR